jgi:uncharacterized protein YndB with AHSA1/START domain
MEIVREVTLDAPADEVWRLLTDEDELAGWLADSATVDLRPGGAAEFVDAGEVRRARIDEVDEGRRLRLVWWPETDTAGASEVTFTLDPAEAGTRLVVVERRPGGVSLAGRAHGEAAWDRRLFSLELRCLARSSLVGS